jgi:hypothetical protein
MLIGFPYRAICAEKGCAKALIAQSTAVKSKGLPVRD